MQDGGIHADKDVTPYAEAVEYGSVADNHAIPDGNITLFRTWHSRMDHTIVFNDGLFSNRYFAHIPPDNRVGADNSFFSKLHVANNACGFIHKSGIRNLGVFTVKWTKHR